MNARRPRVCAPAHRGMYAARAALIGPMRSRIALGLKAALRVSDPAIVFGKPAETRERLG